MLKIEFIGHVGIDATLKQFENSNVINFSVAVNESFKDKAGQKQTKTKWIECELWNRPALLPYLKSSSHLFINGKPEVRAYIEKGTQEAKAVQVCNVDEIQFLSKNENVQIPE